jgi:hypothetical protein
MQYAGRIVHHAKGIGNRREVIVLEAVRHLIGKA